MTFKVMILKLTNCTLYVQFVWIQTSKIIFHRYELFQNLQCDTWKIIKSWLELFFEKKSSPLFSNDNSILLLTVYQNDLSHPVQ